MIEAIIQLGFLIAKGFIRFQNNRDQVIKLNLWMKEGLRFVIRVEVGEQWRRLTCGKLSC